MIVESHPLDFDWRYSQKTVSELCDKLQGVDKILCVGSPSIARELERRCKPYLLIDRQPKQFVSSFINISIGDEVAIPEEITTAIIDPPWYPEDLEFWTTWTANLLPVGSRIYVSIWPEDTRPRARDELLEILGAFSNWATVVRNLYDLRYDRPIFEVCAARNYSSAPPQSPLRGELIELLILKKPRIKKPNKNKYLWSRYVSGEYQLAVRSRKTDSLFIEVSPLFNSQNWIWASVSRRTYDRNLIDVWSSRNEVATVSNPFLLIELLDSILIDKNIKENDIAQNFPIEFQEWAMMEYINQRWEKWTHFE